ncbi:MAG: peptidyl-prolyl cis-trans isomerase [Bacteroidota bacterium]
MPISRTKEESAIRFPLFFFISLLIAAAGCTQTEENGSVVARVNDKVLTMESIRKHIDPSQQLTQSEIQQYANRWVINELLFQEAQQRGYDGSEQIKEKMEEALKQLTIADLLEKEVYSMADGSIQQSEIATYFQEHGAEFTLQENIIRLSMVVFRDLEPANQFRTAALGVDGWHKSLERFGDDMSKGVLSATDSSFYPQSSLYPPELWKVATAMGIQEVSFPVKTSVGYVVIRSLGQFKSGTSSPLAYVEQQIRSRLIMERRQLRYQQYLQSLRSKHSVQIMTAVQDSLTSER